MNRSKQVLIRIYLYIFKNTLSNIKILDKNIKHSILKKAEKNKKNRKDRKNFKKQNFSGKSRRGDRSRSLSGTGRLLILSSLANNINRL